MNLWIRVSSLAIVSYLSLYLLGCQQTHIAFTDTAATTLPQFNKIQAAPAVNIIAPEFNHQVEQLNLFDDGKLFIFSDPQSGLDQLTLVAYSKLPFANVDVLLAAFEEKRRWLSAKHSLSCTEAFVSGPLYTVLPSVLAVISYPMKLQNY